MPVSSVQSNDAMGDGFPPVTDFVTESSAATSSAATSSAAEVPAWLVANRERQGKVAVPSTKPNEVKPSEELAAARTATVAVPRSRPKSSAAVITVLDEPEEKPGLPSRENWITRWFASHTGIGFTISLALHGVTLAALAFIFFSNVTLPDTINLWGVVGETDEEASDLLIDTTLPSDGGGESAPLQMTTDVAKNLESLGAGANVPEMVRVGLGGNGNGQGGSGNGTMMGVGSLKIPGHAQTKGSFSAWTDPRDPEPGKAYFIVIQIRLPNSVKKYKGSDLTGLVSGTDRYKQEIRFKSSDQFPVETGVVEIRIPVPGGAIRVRDTIHIESKLLHEKQTFEIEF